MHKIVHTLQVIHLEVENHHLFVEKMVFRVLIVPSTSMIISGCRKKDKKKETKNKNKL